MADELQKHRRLAAIMFTDMVGYSALAQKNEALALELLNEHRKVLRQLFSTHGGREIEAIGDGFFVECPSALAAARCAVEIQRTLHERNASQPPERHFEVRIGLHLGDVVAEGDHVHGDGVNIAARIEPLAQSGGICLSEDVARQIQNKIDFPLRLLGKGDLKNIRMPVDIYRIVLPWEPKQLRGSDRLAFGMRHHELRRTLLGAGGIVVATGLAGTWLWRRTQVTKPPLVSDRSNTPAPSRVRIAVLPFANLSAHPDDEYFADGITEELITRLSQIPSLEVIARTSVMTYKGSRKKIGEIGQELTVGTILEGSVRKGTNGVRITAQLISVENEAHLWAETYDREIKDVFAVQTDVARRVADALAVQLGPDVPRLSGSRGTEDLEAYTIALRGRHWANKDTEEGLKKGIDQFKQAIRRDPAFALANAWLADAHTRLPFIANVSVKENYSLARQEALRALELNSSLPEAYTALGQVKVYYDWDWVGAKQAFTRALELSPSHAPARHGYAWYLLSTRQRVEAIKEMQRALTLDPVSAVANVDLGWFLHAAGRNDEAISQFRKTLELDANNGYAYLGMVHTYARLGMTTEADAALARALDLLGRNSWTMPDMAFYYGRSGRTEMALDVVEELSANASRQPVQAYMLLLAYTGLSERDPKYNDKLFEWLNKSYAERTNYAGWINGSQWWDHVRPDPRFAEVIAKMGLQ